MKDYYAILEVPADASPADLTEAYRAKVRVTHPDRFHTRQQKGRMHEQMLLINEAYGVLYDPQSRAHYDQKHLPHNAMPSGEGQAPHPSVILQSSPIRKLVLAVVLVVLTSLGMLFHGLIPVRLLLLATASALLIYRYPMPPKPTLNCVLIAITTLLFLNAFWNAMPVVVRLFLFLGLFYGLRLLARKATARKQYTSLP